jgi:hypothetical protein
VSIVSARRYGVFVAINVVIGVLSAVVPSFTHASTPSDAKPSTTTHTHLVRRVEHTSVELVRNGNFQHGRAHWRTTGPAHPRLRIVHPGAHSRHAAFLSAHHRGGARLSEHLIMRPAAAGNRYHVSAVVRRTARHRTHVMLRLLEVNGAHVVGKRTRWVVLHHSRWRRMGFNYTDRRAGSRLVVEVGTPAPRHRRAFYVDNVRVVQSRKIVMVPVTNPNAGQPGATGGDPTPTPTPTSGTPTGSPTPTPTQSIPAPPVTPSSGCTRSALLVPSCGVLWGAYAPLASGQTWAQDTTSLESTVGRPFDITYRYHDFSTAGPGAFPDSSEQALAASGHVLLDDWAARVFSTGVRVQWADIAAGKYDASVVDPEAQRIKAFGKPVMLSFDHEMDRFVGTSGTTSGTAADYVAAYRHIHDEFARLGVTNVIWVWTPTGSSVHFSMYPSLYPGSSYVDWIGYDPYNFFNCHSAGWKNFTQTVDPMYQWLETNGYGNKPFILPEYGTVPDPNNPAAEADWYSQIPGVLATHPNIKAMVAWDDQVGTCDTRLTTSPGELNAFTAVGHSGEVTSATS